MWTSVLEQPETVVVLRQLFRAATGQRFFGSGPLLLPLKSLDAATALQLGKPMCLPRWCSWSRRVPSPISPQLSWATRSLRTLNNAAFNNNASLPWFATTLRLVLNHELRYHFPFHVVHVWVMMDSLEQTRHEQVMFVYVWKQVFSTYHVWCTCHVRCTTFALGAGVTPGVHLFQSCATGFVPLGA